jgi:hypothetical protein
MSRPPLLDVRCRITRRAFGDEAKGEKSALPRSKPRRGESPGGYLYVALTGYNTGEKGMPQPKNYVAYECQPKAKEEAMK